MPSPRSRFETACRVGAFALLGWMLGTSIIPVKSGRLERVQTSELTTRLPQLTRSAGNVAIHVAMPTTPQPWQTDWLRALDHSGRALSWSGSPPAVAMSIEPIADPDGGMRVDVAAPNGSVVALHDDASAIDSVKVANLGATIATPIAVGTIRGQVNGETFSSPANDSVRLKAVMVVGAAGWEGKYVVSALEERGWPVIARFTIAPNVDVTQGTIQALDTSRVGVLIAIDSTVSTLGDAVARFVRSGGGLVLAGPASSAKNVATIAPGAISQRTRPNVKPTDTVRLGSTGFYPVSLKDDGIALEKRTDGIAVAARRLGAGRIVQVGYDDSWRWRMAGASGSERAHREWWSRIVAAVAYAPIARTAALAGAPSVSTAAAAPLVAVTDRLGPPRVLSSGIPSPPVDRRWLIAAMMVLLLIEWASRRLRGMR
ncbi:MAG TPA: hypothetical protein VGM82_05790 [Gemmatimonadaceae bacterium]|jgi:hypothetical protein